MCISQSPSDKLKYKERQEKLFLAMAELRRRRPVNEDRVIMEFMPTLYALNRLVLGQEPPRMFMQIRR